MDYFETFAPVVRYDSLRAMLAIAAIQDLKIRQLDIKGGIPEWRPPRRNLYATT
jgi:hypothetical protein